MARFARDTTVPVERSRAEIEETLKKYGATAFTSGWNEHSSMIAFRFDNLLIRFVLPMPLITEKRFTHKEVRGKAQKRSELQAKHEWEQEIRARWRGLLLNIKGKLEATELGITTREEEFLAHIVLPNDMRLGEWLIAEALPQIMAGNVPQLGYKPADPKADAQPQDAEFEVKQ